jgi:peptide/nickel transport system substrate-binding protein
MTADDVAGSLKRVVDPSFGSWWAFQMGSMKSIVVNDAKTVTIELNEPFTPLLASLAASMTAILPMKELAAKSFDPSKELLGTGPFKVTKHQQNDFWILDRNPFYWRQGLPKVDQVVVRIITDDARGLLCRDRAAGEAVAEGIRFFFCSLWKRATLSSRRR